MSAVGAVVDAVFGSYDLKNAISWRNADLEREKRVHKLDHEKRIIDARHKQLCAISQISALLTGFSMITMTEINLPSDVNDILLVFFGGFSATVVSVSPTRCDVSGPNCVTFPSCFRSFSC